MIKLGSLNKYFNKNKKNQIHVLNDINLTIEEKGLVVLLGPSGSGKTTLLNVIGGLDKVNSGTFEFDDKKISGYDYKMWDQLRNDTVGFVFQNYNLLPDLSVFDNVAFALRLLGIVDQEEIKVRVNYILKMVGMYPFRKKKGFALSGGQQQRVAIARALVKNPKVIIADEPTGNLDSKNTLEVMNIIKSISKETLVILVTHERDLASYYADRIIEIKDGRIISDNENHANPEQQFADENVVYLKDYAIQDVINNDKIKINYYGDQLKDIKVNLIVKNDTLYLEVASDFKKVQLADRQSGLTIKDEHYAKKSKEETLKTEFDRSIIDHSNLKKEAKLIISIKQSLFRALAKVASFGKKGKLMLFVFGLGGAVFAFIAAGLLSVLLSTPERFLERDSNYYYVERSGSSYDDFKSLVSDDIYLSKVEKASFYVSNYHDSAYVEYSDFLTNNDLYKGSLPTNDFEIVLSYGIFDDGQMTMTNIRDVGIWAADDLIGEMVTFKNSLVYKVVGVAKTNKKIVYFNSPAAYRNSEFSTGIFSKTIVEEDRLIAESSFSISGSYGNPGYKLVALNQMFDVDGDKITYEQIDIFTVRFYVDSSHWLYQRFLTETFSIFVAAVINESSEQVNRYIFEGSLRGFYMRSSQIDLDARVLLENGYKVEKADSHAITQNNEYIRRQLTSNLIFQLVIIIGTALGFYFVMRSSMVSRIYEISVHRALGVRKRDLLLSFLVEVVFLTSISSLIGYSLMTFTLTQISGSSLRILFSVDISFLSVVLGLLVMYGLNIIVGLLPLAMLLRKTPAQIISKYDI